MHGHVPFCPPQWTEPQRLTSSLSEPANQRTSARAAVARNTIPANSLVFIVAHARRSGGSAVNRSQGGQPYIGGDVTLVTATASRDRSPKGMRARTRAGVCA